MDFILSARKDHKDSKEYLLAKDADLYYKHQNPTIMNYQKYIYNQMGKAVPDIWSANNKIASSWYNYFTVQAVQYLLGNGVSFKEESTKEKLGKKFDKVVQDLATQAKNASVSFGFWNYDHLEMFTLLEFVPLYDEEDGALKAGIRYWQVDETKPERMTLYELDGYTDYIKRPNKDMEVFHEKRAYTQIVQKSEVEGEKIYDGENYPTFPIVPFYNVNKQSDLIGNRGTLDAYDLVASDLVNNISEGDFIYWVLKNCGGMSAEDDAKFIEQLKLTHVAHADGDGEGSEIQAHKVEAPYQGNAVTLERLEKQLFKDFMALKVEDISANNVTNDQIEAAYEPLNQKTDQFEYQVTDFIEKILELAGIEDTPTYTRSQMSNKSETLDGLLQCAEYLDEEYMTKKILTLLGDADMVDDVLAKKMDENVQKFANAQIDMEDDEEDPANVAGAQEAIDEAEKKTGKMLNGAQTQSIITVMKQYGAGQMTEGQAVTVISVAIGVSKDEARAILKGE